MKYIRTKDELGILVENNKDIKDKYGDYLKKGCYFKTWFSPNTNREDIIKQVDTIDELCDEFLIKGTRCIYLGIPLQECELRNIPITQIYGAIWTDKGLIYVAKMNDKGELELL